MTEQTVQEKPDVIRTSKDTRNLKCRLTEEEVAAAAEEVARLVQERDQLESDKKAYVSSFKSKIDAANASITEQSNLIRNKYAYRTVPCRAELNYTQTRVKVTRTDTNEVIEDRLMNYAEKDSQTIFDGPKSDIPGEEEGPAESTALPTPLDQEPDGNSDNPTE